MSVATHAEPRERNAWLGHEHLLQQDAPTIARFNNDTGRQLGELDRTIDLDEDIFASDAVAKVRAETISHQAIMRCEAHRHVVFTINLATRRVRQMMDVQYRFAGLEQAFAASGRDAQLRQHH
jgi:hypothetical protein